MGIFDFVKSVGKKLGIGDDEEAPKEEDLKKELDSHAIGSDKIEVKVVGDKAILKGSVADQTAFEKAVIEAEQNRNGGRMKETYETLGLSRKGLYDKIRRLGIESEAGDG